MSSPTFSVVMPTHDRREVLQRVLAAYARQQPAELRFEVIVVDDGSSDGTAAWASTWRSARYDYHFLSQRQQGPAAARNRALARARGELVLFTGDDIEPTPTLLAEHRRAHAARPELGTAILGQTCWHPEAPLTATMRHIDGVGAQQFSYHYMEDGAEYDFRHFYTSNVSARRELLAREPQGFSTEFRHAAFEDAELAYRLVRHGLRIFYRSAGLAYHHHAYGARSFFARQVRCGEMAVVLARKYPQLETLLGLAPLTPLARLKLAGGLLRRRRTATLAATLPQCEESALSRAEAWDRSPGEAADRFFLSLYRYGYLKGAACGRLRRRTAERFCAALLGEEMQGPLAAPPPLVSQFSESFSATGPVAAGASRVPSRDLGREA